MTQEFTGQEIDTIVDLMLTDITTPRKPTVAQCLNIFTDTYEHARTHGYPEVASSALDMIAHLATEAKAEVSA